MRVWLVATRLPVTARVKIERDYELSERMRESGAEDPEGFASPLLAPMVFPRMCTDSTEPRESYCTDLPAQTLLGSQAHVRLWVAVLAAIAVATVVLLVWPRSRRSM